MESLLQSLAAVQRAGLTLWRCIGRDWRRKRRNESLEIPLRACFVSVHIMNACETCTTLHSLNPHAPNLQDTQRSILLISSV